MPLTVYFQNRSADSFEVVTAAGALVDTVAPSSAASVEIEGPGMFFIEDTSTAEIRAVTLVNGSAVAVSASGFVSVAPQGVHVRNPVQGMEFVLLAAGFIVGAITWRFLMGRW